MDVLIDHGGVNLVKGNWHMNQGPITLGMEKAIGPLRVVLFSLGWFLVMFLAENHAYGQFVVQPMMIEATPRGGTLVEAEIQLQNWSREATHHVGLSVTDLTQEQDGNWSALDDLALKSNPDTSKLTSCRDWIQLETFESTVNPMGLEPVKIKIHVPLRAKGFYSAAIIASLLPPPDAEGVAVRYDLIVPVMLQIVGSNMRHDVKMVDTGLEYQVGDPFDASKSDTTFVTMEIENNGNTYSRLHGFAQVRMLMKNDKWRVIAPNTRFTEVPIIPGSKLKLKADLERNLPSGKYKVSGALFVDGRRSPALSKDFVFEGPSSATQAAAEVVIRTEPEVVFLESQPGRVRSTTMDIYNQSDKPVNIRAYARIPELFKGKVIPGNVVGEELACADWVEIRPSEFQIRGYGKKTVRFMVRMPSVERHSFYANIKLVATHTADGASAGRKNAMLVVTNKGAAPHYGIHGKSMSLKELHGSRYIVSARFTNVGLVHVQPIVYARAVLEAGNNRNIVASEELKSDGREGLLLPVESRDFAGVFDFSNVTPGRYRLEADLVYGKGANENQRYARQIVVWEENGKMNAAWDTPGTAANINGTPGKASW